MKKAKGSRATMVRLRLKSSMISGINGPMMLVRKDMTKKVKKISRTVG
jgi:hypothetical protein